MYGEDEDERYIRIIKKQKKIIRELKKLLREAENHIIQLQPYIKK